MKSISNGGCLFCLRMDLVFVSTIARGVELSIFPSTLLHTLEMYVSIGSFPFSRASQKWIRNCLRPGGNKKLRAMIRNRSSAPLPARPNAFHATTRFFVSRRLFAPLLRAPAHRKYAAHGTNGFCRGGGPLCSFVTQHLLLSILWTLPDTPWIRRFCLVSFFLSLFFFLSYIRSKGIIGFENLLWISAFSLFHRWSITVEMKIKLSRYGMKMYFFFFLDFLTRATREERSKKMLRIRENDFIRIKFLSLDWEGREGKVE